MNSRCAIVPPYLIARLADHPDARVAASARVTADQDVAFRAGERAPGAVRPSAAAPGAGSGTPQRTISDAAGTTELPGTPVRREGDKAVDDVAVNEAYDGLGATFDLFWSAYQRDSLDGAGLPLLATVHYGQDYDNAFFDGSRMVFGDGDGKVFNRFTLSVDVIGHELTHGVTQYTAALAYQGQSGALNESISDVFGSLVRQKLLGQTADQADWLIGADLFTDEVQGDALRSMKAPGTAYDDDVLGKDPQPATMADYVETTEDNGGVHINSGIPNHAFFLAATTIGGNAWEAPGQIWYDVLTGDIAADCDFARFAELTVAAATARFGSETSQVRAVTEAWATVGVTGETPAPAPAPDPVVASEVTVIRSGGFAGLRMERTVDPADLDLTDAQSWDGLLRSTLLVDTTGTPPADGYVYRVIAPGLGIDTTAAEVALPDDVRALIDRTLRGR